MSVDVSAPKNSSERPRFERGTLCCVNGGMMANAVIDTFPGILRRDDVDLKCTVLARRVTLPGTGVFEHVNPSILTVMGEVSDGLYELLVNGKAQFVRRTDGQWLAP